jgi:hypothetical protein
VMRATLGAGVMVLCKFNVGAEATEQRVIAV